MTAAPYSRMARAVWEVQGMAGCHSTFRGSGLNYVILMAVFVFPHFEGRKGTDGFNQNRQKSGFFAIKKEAGGRQGNGADKKIFKVFRLDVVNISIKGIRHSYFEPSCDAE